MPQSLYTFASTEAAENKDLFGALGIDWRLLVLQVVAFGILVWLLGKFVYPQLVGAIEKREKAIADSVAAANKAEAKAEETQKEIDDMFQKARKEADEIIARSHQEATTMVTEAESKAKDRADQIVSDARAQLNNDVRKAREALKSDTIKLVAVATEEVIHEKLDASKDANLIKTAIGKGQA